MPWARWCAGWAVDIARMAAAAPVLPAAATGPSCGCGCHCDVRLLRGGRLVGIQLIDAVRAFIQPRPRDCAHRVEADGVIEHHVGGVVRVPRCLIHMVEQQGSKPERARAGTAERVQGAPFVQCLLSFHGIRIRGRDCRLGRTIGGVDGGWGETSFRAGRR